MILSADFSFFKAGQGSFYGGYIFNPYDRKQYSMIYDCGSSQFVKGSKSSLHSEIGFFKNSKQKYQVMDQIDLLFISHLDYDHVSGLKYLFSLFNVNRVILPYIEPEIRKFFLLSITTGLTPSENDLSFEDYSKFLESPHTFLKSLNNKSDIYYVTQKSINLEYQGYSDVAEEDIYPVGQPLDKGIDFQELADTDDSVRIYDNNLQFFIRKIWEFSTFVRKVDYVRVEELNRSLKNILNKSNEQLITIEDLKEICTKSREKARECYVENIENVNNFGLTLLHGPIRFSDLSGEVTTNNRFNSVYPGVADNFRLLDTDFSDGGNSVILGTLLLGDVSLSPDNNPITFSDSFKRKIENAHIVQVPHHGSRKNWDFREFKKLNIGINLGHWSSKIFAVCNFGFGNRYNHPSLFVSQDLKNSLLINTQYDRVNITYCYIIYSRP